GIVATSEASTGGARVAAMPKLSWPLAILAALACTRPPLARAAPAPAPATTPDAKPDDAKSSDAKSEELKPEEKTSTGAVTIGGRRIDYTAIAGTLVVHSSPARLRT